MPQGTDTLQGPLQGHGRDDVRLAVSEHPFRFNEPVNAARGNDRRRETGITNGASNPGNSRQGAAESASCIRDLLRASFVYPATV